MTNAEIKKAIEEIAVHLKCIKEIVSALEADRNKVFEETYEFVPMVLNVECRYDKDSSIFVYDIGKLGDVFNDLLPEGKTKDGDIKLSTMLNGVKVFGYKGA